MSHRNPKQSLQLAAAPLMNGSCDSDRQHPPLSAPEEGSSFRFPSSGADRGGCRCFLDPKSTRWRSWLPFAYMLLLALMPFPTRAAVTVTAGVDRNRMALGESIRLTIAVQGSQAQPAPAVPAVDGLAFAGPALFQSVNIVNGQMSQTASLVYQVSAARVGTFTIPAIPVTVAGQELVTEPIAITVEKGTVAEELKDRLFGVVKFEPNQVYVGQTVPVEIRLYARQDVPLRGLGGFQAEAL